MTITVVVPAHNEQGSLGRTLESLRAQSVRVDRIIVAADNCTDDTVGVARAAGVEVFETIANTAKKAGALNQALAGVTTEYFLAVDADTTLSPDFIEIALEILGRRLDIAAVGGVFVGREPRGLLQLAQNNEYVRYGREIDRTGRTLVLSGTAALVRLSAARQVSEARGDTLPGSAGDIYDRAALTEDMEFGLALKTLGWKLASPVDCSCDTELMPTLGDLHRQRLRWYRGALENLVHYGLTRVTARYWFQQFMLVLVTLMVTLYLVLLVADIALGLLGFSPFWAGVGLLFVLERVVTAWRAGAKGRLLAGVILLEFSYDVFLQATFVRAVLKAATKSTPQWAHLSTIGR